MSRKLVGVALLLLSLSFAPPASALSCVEPPEGFVPARQLVLTGGFEERFDGAVEGVVRSVDRRQPPRDPLVVVEVERSYGPRLRGEVEIVGSSWTPLLEGGRYFIPYLERHGRRHIILCRDSPTQLTSPPTAQRPAVTAPAVEDDDDVWGHPATWAALVASLGAASLLVWLRRRSRA